MTPTTFLSLDSGDHWASVGPSAAGVSIDPSAPDFVVLYNGTANLVVSTDGGATFDTTDHRSSEMKRAAIGGVVFEPETSQAFVACARGVFTATDHGLQWTEIDTGLQAWTVGPIGVAATGEIYVPTGAGVMRSLDDGASWDLETSGLPQLQVNQILIPPDAPNDIIAIGDKYISDSANRGASFTTLFTAAAQDGNGLGRARVAGSQISSRRTDVRSRQPGSGCSRRAMARSGRRSPASSIASQPASPPSHRDACWSERSVSACS